MRLNTAFASLILLFTISGEYTFAQTSSWTKCATEGQKCSFTGTRRVLYGQSTVSKNKILTRSNRVGCNNRVFGDPAPGITKACWYEVINSPPPVVVVPPVVVEPPVVVVPPVTSSWIACATEGQTCSFTGSREVRYGTTTQFVANTFTNSVSCSNDVFGDPIYGTAKNCWYSAQTTTPPPVVVEPPPVVVVPPVVVEPPPVVVVPPVTPAGLPFINVAMIPAPVVGESQVQVVRTGEMPYDGGGIGSFRSVCGYSHMNFDDAIVFPGQPGAAHLHVYFGNTLANASTTPANITTRGNSTCRGGILNRSAYWAPVMIDTRNGAPMRPRISNVYYKSGYQGLRPDQIQPMPKGLRMISGDAKSTVVRQWDHTATYGCNDGGQKTIPTCQPGSELEMHIDFPQCWDGVNLDSADHKSHMAFGTGNGCPSTHPVAIPVISMIMMYPVVGQDTSTWRLSSDINGAPAGTSGHADWMNGWTGESADEYIPDVFVRRIINLGLDGGSHMLGDGRIMMGSD